MRAMSGHGLGLARQKGDVDAQITRQGTGGESFELVPSAGVADLEGRVEFHPCFPFGVNTSNVPIG